MRLRNELIRLRLGAGRGRTDARLRTATRQGKRASRQGKRASGLGQASKRARASELGQAGKQAGASGQGKRAGQECDLDRF